MTLPALPSLDLFSPDVVQTLGWTLIHFLWQGLALALLFQAVSPLLRTANARYNLAFATLTAMALAPVVTFFALDTIGGGIDPIRLGADITDDVIDSVSAGDAPAASPWLHWLVAVWCAGVAALSCRVAGGWYVAQSLRHRATQPLPPGLRARFEALRMRLGISRPVRFLQSALVGAPAVVGWLRPVVLIPASAVMGLTQTQLEAVIIHELAHIRRLDALANLLQMAVETALFYHPAVWWISRRIRVEREHCCDDIAVITSGDALGYAKALASLEEWRALPPESSLVDSSLVMAASGGVLKHRISRLLGLNIRGGNVSVIGVAGVGLICLVGCVIAQGADADVTVPAPRPLPGLAPIAAAAAELPSPPATPAAPAAPRAAAAPVLIVPPAPAAPAAAALPATLPVPALPEDLKHLHIDVDFDADDDVRDRIHDMQREIAREQADFAREQAEEARQRAEEVRQEVRERLRERDRDHGPRHPGREATAEEKSFIAEMDSAGLKGLDADDLIELKAVGVTPAYVRELTSAGVQASKRQIVAFKAQGLDPAYIKDMRAAAAGVSASQLLALRSQGISPQYVRDIHAAWPDAGISQVIALHNRGVNPDYIKAVRAAWQDISVNDMLAMSALGISPKDAAEYRKSGPANLSVREMFSYKNVGVTPEFVNALKAAGIKDLSVRDYTTAKVRGITPEFLDAVRKHGFNNLTMRQLIALKDADVL